MAVSEDADGDRRLSRHYGLRSLRACARRVLIQTGSSDAGDATGDATTQAAEVAEWCVQDGAAADAATALDAGRSLTLHAASVSVPTGNEPAEPDPPQVGRSEERLTVPASSRSRVLQSMINEAVSTTDAARDLLDPPLLENVRRTLSQNGAHALVYLVRPSDEIGPTAVLVPARGEPSIVDLPMAAASTTGDFIDALAGNDRLRDLVVPGRPTTSRLVDTLPGLCRWAWDAVMGRVLRHCEQIGFPRPYRLVLVPMGELGIVPWHAARSPDGRLVVQDAVISYAASARLLCEVTGRPVLATAGDSLVVGDPTGDLRYAGLEAEAIQSAIYPVARYLGRGSTAGPGTAAQVVDWLNGTVSVPGGVLHLACHGVVRTTGAERSQLLLAPDGSDAFATSLT
jgi:hypothetical protein